MRHTFGSKLLEFSKSIDILEIENFNTIQLHVETYLYRVLQIKYVRLMLVHEMVDGQLMLQKYVLNRTEEGESLLIRDKKGAYNGQMAYALVENKKLWIRAEERGVSLEDCNGKYVESWSKSEELPLFKKFDEREKVQTSIIIPIRRDNKINDSKHIFGVVNFESKEQLPMTKNAQKELENISYALGKLFQLYEGRKFQQVNTSSVIDEYGKFYNFVDEEDKEFFFKLRPSIFFAFSSRADKAVTNSIKELIRNNFHEEFSLVTWDDPNNVGFITTQLLKSMSKSDYLICYLSEKEKEAELYQDNPNVLIELGFFMGKDKEYESCSNVIVVREEQSNFELPFDIRDIFTLDVSRFDNKEKTLDTELFMKELTGKLQRSLGSSEM